MLPIANQNSTQQRRSAGFTLAELLIVVAIITVLVAIAIPVFISATKTAEEATCSANRRSVRAMVVDAYLLDQTLQVNDELVKKYADALQAQNSDRSLCPNGGTYGSGNSNTENGNAVITIKCSTHGMGLDDEMYQWLNGTLEDAWGKGYHELEKLLGVKITSDADLRKYYSSINNMSTWPKLDTKNEKGRDLYLEFKSYNNKPSGLFLYAGTEKDLTKPDWTAYYICDNSGLLGESSKGQWYKIPEGISIATNTSTGEAVMEEILKANQGNKVNLVNGKFVPAS